MFNRQLNWGWQQPSICTVRHHSKATASVQSWDFKDRNTVEINHLFDATCGVSKRRHPGFCNSAQKLMIMCCFALAVGVTKRIGFALDQVSEHSSLWTKTLLCSQRIIPRLLSIGGAARAKAIPSVHHHSQLVLCASASTVDFCPQFPLCQKG